MLRVLERFMYLVLAGDRDYCRRYSHRPHGPTINGKRICGRCNTVLVVDDA